MTPARVLLAWVLLTTTLSAQPPQLVDGPGVDIARTKCLGCHGADLIAEQRLTRPAWDREIAKMERWGAPLTAADREQLLTYLGSRFGATSAPSHEAPASQGEAIYQAACRACHEDDLTAQQRLSAAAWGRTVDKMVRWGAKVTVEQRDPLVAYLSARYGPKR